MVLARPRRDVHGARAGSPPPLGRATAHWSYRSPRAWCAPAPTSCSPPVPRGRAPRRSGCGARCMHYARRVHYRRPSLCGGSDIDLGAHAYLLDMLGWPSQRGGSDFCTGRPLPLPADQIFLLASVADQIFFPEMNIYYYVLAGSRAEIRSAPPAPHPPTHLGSVRSRRGTRGVRQVGGGGVRSPGGDRGFATVAGVANSLGGQMSLRATPPRATH